jgi:undecaprenyl-diphosphatase
VAPGAQSRWRPAAHTRWAAVVPVSLGLAAACLILFAWLAEEVFEGGTDQFDNAIRATVHQHAAPWLTVVMSRITLLGDWMGILAGTCCLLLICGWRRKWGVARLVLVTMAGAGLLDATLKLAFHRPRPDPFVGTKPSTWSFPSGHALVSLCFYGLIAGILSLRRTRRRWERTLIWTGAALLVGTIGFSRIYLGVHWPSDVLAGYAAGLIWMGTVRALGSATEKDQAGEGPDQDNRR